MPLAPGHKFGAYEIVAPLGAGGMGEVYRARDSKLGREVAIKVLPESIGREPAALARFEREARAVAALSHPNILAIFDFGTHDGVAFAAMELLDGESLRARLANGPLGSRKAAEIGAQIAQGLAAAHEKGIVHRDLKPDNVFVTRAGGVKILDFGLARQQNAAGPDSDQSPTLSRHTDPGMVMGTVGYMSPEQVRGVPVDHRSDIFSFGAVLYEMLTGRRAFQRETAAETMTAILKEEPAELASLVPDVPPAFARIVHHCLEKKADERFQSARDLAFDLAALSGGSGLSTTGARPVVEKAGASRLLLPAAVLLAAIAAFVAGRQSAGPAGPGGGGIVGPKPPTYTQLTDQSGLEGRPSLSPDGKSVVYVSAATGNNDVYLLRVGGRNPVNLTADTKDDDVQPAFSPDGERIAFRSEREGGGIFLMGTTGESARRLTDFGYTPGWSPDGKKLAVAADTFVFPSELGGKGGGLSIVDVDSGAVRKLEGLTSALKPKWSPNGRRLAYWGLRGTSGQRDVWTVASDGSEKAGVEVTNDAALDWSPEWSPDGRYLYFSSDRGGSMNLWRMAIDQDSGRVLAAPEPLTTPSGWTGAMSLSRDGKRIAYETLDWRSTLWRVAFDSAAEKAVGSPTPILRLTLPIRDHEVSPDGEQVAFTRAGTHEDLFVARIDGTQFRRLTDDAFRDRGPAWSPDGRTIAFYSDRGGGYEVWSIRPDGSGLEALSSLGRSANFPTWSPDGKRMVFSSTAAGGIMIDPTARPAKDAEVLPFIRPNVMFWPFSWSSDGQRIGGIAVESDGRVQGMAVYDMTSKSYKLFDESAGVFFRNGRWLADGRRLLVRNQTSLDIVDTRTGQKRPVLPVLLGYAIGKSVGITRDDRWITYTETAPEGDIWLASWE